jgi:hypothetical protein
MRADLSFGGNRSDRSNVIRDAQVIGEPFSASSCGPETGLEEIGARTAVRIRPHFLQRALPPRFM